MLFMVFIKTLIRILFRMPNTFPGNGTGTRAKKSVGDPGGGDLKAPTNVAKKLASKMGETCSLICFLSQFIVGTNFG